MPPRLKFARPALALCLGAVVLTGCNNANLKENFGTGVGALVGAGLGNVLCKNSDNRKLCTALGGALGAVVGKRIGKRLDERDRQRHAQAMQEVLVADQPGSSAQWQNPVNGTAGEVKVVQQRQTRQTASIPVLKDKVEQVPPIEIIGEVYTTRKNVNVRTGPGTDYKKAPPSLTPGEEFDVVGRVVAQPNWLMIAKDGLGSGYVHAGLVQPTNKASVTTADSGRAGARQIPVETVNTCKVVVHTISYADGQQENETVEMCQRSDGSWDIV